MAVHECDLFVLTPAGWAWEVEIKVTKADLKNDAKKWHGHNNRKIKFLYFALPDYLRDFTDLVPERAGIIIVDSAEPAVDKYNGRTYIWPRLCHTIRKPRANKEATKLSDFERYKVARLGALRIWRLKEKLSEKDGS
jgi:hypothetical protein